MLDGGLRGSIAVGTLVVGFFLFPTFSSPMSMFSFHLRFNVVCFGLDLGEELVAVGLGVCVCGLVL